MRRSQWLVALSIIALTVFLVGCGGGSEPERGEQEASQGGQAAAEPAGTATIGGTVHFEGTAPERTPLDVNRECMQTRDEPPLSQSVVVNDNGTLRWVFVYVKEGLGEQAFPVSSEPAILDQQGCMYAPHVFGAQVGQPIQIRNSDPFQHNIHALPEVNRPFNFSQPVQGMESERTFQQPEVMVRIKCDVHGWMEAWAGIVPHPYHSTTGEQGGYSLANLPAGEYVVEAWHEEYGTQTQTVTVGDGETVTADFTFSPEAAARSVPGGKTHQQYATWTVKHAPAAPPSVPQP